MFIGLVRYWFGLCALWRCVGESAVSAEAPTNKYPIGLPVCFRVASIYHRIQTREYPTRALWCGLGQDRRRLELLSAGLLPRQKTHNKTAHSDHYSPPVLGRFLASISFDSDSWLNVVLT